MQNALPKPRSFGVECADECTGGPKGCWVQGKCRLCRWGIKLEGRKGEICCGSDGDVRPGNRRKEDQRLPRLRPGRCGDGGSPDRFSAWRLFRPGVQGGRNSGAGAARQQGAASGASCGRLLKNTLKLCHNECSKESRPAPRRASFRRGLGLMVQSPTVAGLRISGARPRNLQVPLPCSTAAATTFDRGTAA